MPYTAGTQQLDMRGLGWVLSANPAPRAVPAVSFSGGAGAGGRAHAAATGMGSLMSHCVMFLDCPANTGTDGDERCGLPAYVYCRYLMNSADGPLEAAMIRCPAGHLFNAPVAFLTWDKCRGAGVGRA
jgi:hypothetical protein